MKTMMKKVLLTKVAIFLSVLLCIGTSYAQNVENLTSTRSNMLQRDYLRPSISKIYMTDGSSLASSIAEHLEKYVDRKFDINEIVTTDLKLDGQVDFSSTESVANFQKTVTQELNQLKVGNQIMHCWFPKFENGSYSTDVLTERGRFGATDDNIAQIQASHRNKDVMLNSLGEQLIDRSYVLVYYIYSTKDKSGNNIANMEALVYKLNFDATVMNNFYTKNFKKSNGIDISEFPIDFVYCTKEKKGIASYLGIGSHGVAITNNTTIATVAEQLYETIGVQIGQNIADFQIKTPIVTTSPIGAKIGTKEGLRTDRRFYVMENVLNSEGEPVSTRRGAVRVGTYIADNNKVSDGNSSDYTKFFQYTGGQLTEGMTLVEMPDLGVGLTPILNFMYLGGEIDYRVGDLVSMFMKKKSSIPGIYAYMRLAIPFGTKASKNDGFGIVTLPNNNGVDQILLRFTIGLRKEFNFLRRFNASANIGYGAYGLPDGYENNSWSYIDLGARFGIYVHPNINIFGMAAYEATFFSSPGSSRNVFSNGKTLNKNFGISPFNVGIGARISF